MRALLLPLLLLILPFSAVAEQPATGVQVTPVSVEIAAVHGLSSIRVRNWRDREVSFEVSVYSWTQRDGEDVLTPTSDLIVAPSVFAMTPGAAQIIRLALPPDARKPPPTFERAYRLILRELPAPRDKATGLRVLLQMSLPVFVPPADPEGGLTAHRFFDAGEGHKLLIENTGNAHVRLGDAVFSDNEPVGSLPRYLLAGQKIVRPLRSPEQSLTIAYATSGADAPISETLPLDAPTPARRLP